MSASVDLDAEASSLGITKGHKYKLDFFFAERHPVDSTFHMETTIEDLAPGMTYHIKLHPNPNRTRWANLKFAPAPDRSGIRARFSRPL